MRLCICLLLAIPAFASDKNLKGSYEASLKGANMIMLELRDNGSAILSEDIRGKVKTEEARWNRNRNDVQLEFLAPAGKTAPSPAVFELKGDSLVPKTWSDPDFGSEPAPVLHKVHRDR